MKHSPTAAPVDGNVSGSPAELIRGVQRCPGNSAAVVEQPLEHLAQKQEQDVSSATHATGVLPTPRNEAAAAAAAVEEALLWSQQQ